MGTRSYAREAEEALLFDHELYPEHGYKLTDPNDGLAICFCGMEWYSEEGKCEAQWDNE